MEKEQNKYINLFKRIYQYQTEIQNEDRGISLYEYGSRRLELAYAYMYMNETENADILFDQCIERWKVDENGGADVKIFFEVISLSVLNSIIRRDFTKADLYIKLLSTEVQKYQNGKKKDRMLAVMYFLTALSDLGQNKDIDEVLILIQKFEQLYIKRVTGFLVFDFDLCILVIKALYYFNVKNYKTALKYYELALQHTVENAQNIEQTQIYHQIAVTYEKLLDSKKATEYYNLYIHLREQIYYERNYAYSRYLIFIYDIQHKEEEAKKLKGQNRHLNEKSNIDALTGLYNRRVLQQVIDEMFSEKHNKRVKLCAIMLDVDCFKRYNDNYGHISGDEILKQVSHLILGYKAEGVYPIRYGGEEFLVILQGGEDTDGERIAKSILKDVFDSNIPHNYSQVCNYLTLSAGVASGICSSGDDFQEMLEQADEALYVSKETGKNRCTIYTPSLNMH